MFYDFAVVVPASTAETDPVEQEMKLTTGIVHRVEVQFPPGCWALAHCRIMHGGHQFLPTNPSGNFATDDYTIPIDEHYELTAGSNILKAVCWNEDDTYSHEITIRVGVQPREVLEPLSGFKGALSKFLSLVGIKV